MKASEARRLAEIREIEFDYRRPCAVTLHRTAVSVVGPKSQKLRAKS